MNMGAAVRDGYKQTQMGVLPVEWQPHVLNSVCERIGVGLATSVTKHYRQTGVPIVRNLNIKDGYFDGADMLYVSEEFAQANSSKAAKAFDVLTVHTGSNLGQTCVLPSMFNDCQTFTTLITTPKRRLLDPNYLCSHMSSVVGRKEMDRLQVGGGKGNLNTGDLKKYRIALPPIPEQRAIAGALSDADALLAKLDALIAKKRDLKQAAMQRLLTGQTRLPGFSGEMEVKRLGDLFTFSGGHTASRDQLSDSGYCYLHYGDIHLSQKTFINVEAELSGIPKLKVRLSDVTPSSLLKDGDVVFVDASEDDDGTSKHVVVVNSEDRPYISGLHTIVAKSKVNVLDNRFKRYCFQTRSIKEQFRFFAVGTKVSGISKTSIAKIELNFPPSLEEQDAIATILSDMDAELAALEARRDKTRAIKQGMMQELLTGRIRLV